MSVLAQRAAVVARLNTGPAGSAKAYTVAELDELAVLPDLYTEVHVTERVSEVGRFGGPSDASAWRIFLRFVARDEENAQTMRHRAGANLVDASLVVEGRETTVITRSAADDPIAPDDGWFSGTSEFIYST